MPHEESASSPELTLRPWLAARARRLGIPGRGARLLTTLALLAWLLSGIYNVQPDQQGVEIELGRWVATTQPGLHYHWPWPLERVLLPSTTQIQQLQLGHHAVGSAEDSVPAQMLTGDENIVEADCAVFWRIKDAGQFLFRVKDPERALRVAAESALRDVVARTPLQASMSTQRQQVAEQTQALLQRWLDEQQSGIAVVQVQLQRVDPPAQVLDAFNDVQRARADQERARNEAQAYSNEVVPKAHGEADRIQQDALAYSSQVVNLAEGEAQRFTLLASSFNKARDVTAWRMYMDSVDDMLKGAGKVVVIDSNARGVAAAMPYLQLPQAEAASGKAKP